MSTKAERQQELAEAMYEIDRLTLENNELCKRLAEHPPKAPVKFPPSPELSWFGGPPRKVRRAQQAFDAGRHTDLTFNQWWSGMVNV